MTISIDAKLISLSILVGALIVALSLVMHAKTSRYQFAPSPNQQGVNWVIDTRTGRIWMGTSAPFPDLK